MVAAGTLGLEGLLVLEPLMAKGVESAGTNHEPLSSGGRVQLAGIKCRKHFLDEER